MPKIHRSAIIDPQAQLADDVEVGPNCIIEGRVTLGSGTRLVGGVWLAGPVTIGRNNVLYPNVCLGFEPQHRKYVPGTGRGVKVGDNNLLREGVTIHGATGEVPTSIGDNNMLMCNAHLGHDTVVGNNCTLANAALLAGHVTVFDDAFVGGNGGIHQFCRMGRLAMLGGGAIVTQDIPPFSAVYSTRQVGSINIVGVRRAGFRNNIPNLKRAFAILYNERHTIPNAIDAIERELGSDPLCAELVAFIRTSRRGITHYKQVDEPTEAL